MLDELLPRASVGGRSDAAERQALPAPMEAAAEGADGADGAAGVDPSAAGVDWCWAHLARRAGVPRSIRAQATAEIVAAAHRQGLRARRSRGAREAARRAAAADRAAARVAQEGSDQKFLESVLLDASSLGIPNHKLDEARGRFQEVAVSAKRKARRETLGLSNVHPPDEFKCPLTLAPMRDPVVASDGHSYERKAIEEVLRNSQPRSPLASRQDHGAQPRAAPPDRGPRG